MTTRRRLLVFGLLAGLLVLGVGGWVWWRCEVAREAAVMQKLLEDLTLVNQPKWYNP